MASNRIETLRYWVNDPRRKDRGIASHWGGDPLTQLYGAVDECYKITSNRTPTTNASAWIPDGVAMYCKSGCKLVRGVIAAL
jgi:hypothetical protein